MDLTYITERVIAMTFPMVGMTRAYQDNLREVTRMFKTKHGDKYMVFNLSERRNDIADMNRHVLDFGWPDRLAPPLERLCSICKAIDSWLNSDPQHVVVLHCKGGKERTGVVIEAYRHYSNICASADQALDRFAMKRFYDDKLGSLTQPSQKRYVRYFSGLLSGAIKINGSPLYLNNVVIHGVPNFDGKGGCRAFIKIYQGMQPIYNSNVYNVSGNMQRVVIPIDNPLQLRGDILIKCYHKARPTAREIIFRMQFHTCAISDNFLCLTKEELDDGCHDKRFPEGSRVELKFSSGPGHYIGSSALHDVHSTDSTTDPLVRWDSYENFDSVPEDSQDNLDDLNGRSPSPNYMHGPVDGSLYATITKKREDQEDFTNGHHHHPSVNGIMDELNMANGFHTYSIDSGISSSHPPTHYLNGSASSSSSPAANPSSHGQPNISEEQSKLDEVLNGMLENCQSMPDIKPVGAPHASRALPASYAPPPPRTMTTPLRKPTPLIMPEQLIMPSNNTPTLSPVGTPRLTTKKVTTTYIVELPAHPKLANGELMNDDEVDDGSVPHTRKNCQPFSYLIPTSPRSTRRQIIPGTIIKRTDSPPPPKTPEPRSPTPGILRSYSVDDHRNISPLPTTPEPQRYESEWGLGPEMGGDWLQKQQQKLRDRQQHRYHGDRSYKEQKLIYELRNVQNSKRNGDATDSEDYLSDTLASLDASLGSGFSTPLHVNTYNTYSTKSTTKPPPGGLSAPSSPLIPNRSSSRDVRQRYPWPPPGTATTQTLPASTRPVSRQHSDNSYDRERPFVAVKRAHEQARAQPMHNPSSYSSTLAYTYTQQQPHIAPPLATSSPAGKPASGLLATVPGGGEQRSVSPVSSSLIDLEMSLQAASDRSRSPDHKVKFGGSNVDSPTALADRPNTPGFPVQPRTPYLNRDPSPSPGSGLPPKSPTSSRRAFASKDASSGRNPLTLRRWPSNSSSTSTNGASKERSPSPATVQQIRAGLMATNGHQNGHQPHSANGESSPSVYFGQSRRSSLTSLLESSEVITHTPQFMKDTSKYWYKPNISREDAINMLKDKPPGTFVVRDSNSFPGAYGLALKVAVPPPNVQNKSGDISNELVRHFLIEPTSRGVRLKGCANEPVFGSLQALVYQHSITPLALPCKLTLPDSDPAEHRVREYTASHPSSATQLLAQGAACNVLYLFSVDIETLTGPEAIRMASGRLTSLKPLPVATTVHFKVSSQGITMTDNARKLFFRRHYPVNGISHCGIDPADRRWTRYDEETNAALSTHRIFGFVCAKPTNPNENQCHLFAELEPEQPAYAIVNFVTKVMMATGGPKTPILDRAH